MRLLDIKIPIVFLRRICMFYWSHLFLFFCSSLLACWFWIFHYAFEHYSVLHVYPLYSNKIKLDVCHFSCRNARANKQYRATYFGRINWADIILHAGTVMGYWSQIAFFCFFIIEFCSQMKDHVHFRVAGSEVKAALGSILSCSQWRTKPFIELSVTVKKSIPTSWKRFSFSKKLNFRC